MMFKELRDSGGKKAQALADITLNGVTGLLSSVFKIAMVSIGKTRKTL